MKKIGKNQEDFSKLLFDSTCGYRNFSCSDGSNNFRVGESAGSWQKSRFTICPLLPHTVGKWHSMENQEIFSTSLYGRFGYFVMSIATALVMSIFAGVLKDIIYGNYTDGILFGILIILYEISGSYLIVNCLRNLINPSFRLKITNKNIVYNGFFSIKSFSFESINKVTLDFSGSKSPFVYLLIYSSKRKKPFRLDVSGLKPNYKILYQCIRDRMDSFKNWILNLWKSYIECTVMEYISLEIS